MAEDEFKSYKEGSRVNWGTSRSGNLTDAQIQLGATLRIADSLEKMEQPYLKLISDVEYLRKSRRNLTSENEHLRRSNAAIKGHFSRLKKRQLDD